MIKGLIILGFLLQSCTLNNNDKNKTSDKSSAKDSLIQMKRPHSKSEEVGDSAFLLFWNQFKDIVKTLDQKKFRNISLDSLECEHENVHINKFMSDYFSKVFDDTLVIRFSEKEKIDFVNATMEPGYFSPFIARQLKKDKLTIKEVNIDKSDNQTEQIIVVLKFIETESGYKFYGYDRFG